MNEKVVMDPWPNLYNHDDNWDYKKDIRSAAFISINILEDLHKHLQNIKNVVQLDANQIINALQKSKDDNEEDKLNSVKSQLEEVLQNYNRFEEFYAERTAKLLELQAVAQDRSTDDMSHLTIKVATECYMKLIEVFHASTINN